jgi:hypothetical protein
MVVGGGVIAEPEINQPPTPRASPVELRLPEVLDSEVLRSKIMGIKYTPECLKELKV